MILEFGKFKIVTDERQFVLQEKGVKQAGKYTKDENVGDVYYTNIGYFSKLDNALKHIGKLIVLRNDDLKVIKRELRLLDNKISEFTKQLELEELAWRTF